MNVVIEEVLYYFKVGGIYDVLVVFNVYIGNGGVGVAQHGGYGIFVYTALAGYAGKGVAVHFKA